MWARRSLSEPLQLSGSTVINALPALNFHVEVVRALQSAPMRQDGSNLCTSISLAREHDQCKAHLDTWT